MYVTLSHYPDLILTDKGFRSTGPLLIQYPDSKPSLSFANIHASARQNLVKQWIAPKKHYGTATNPFSENTICLQKYIYDLIVQNFFFTLVFSVFNAISGKANYCILWLLIVSWYEHLPKNPTLLMPITNN